MGDTANKFDIQSLLGEVQAANYNIRQDIRLIGKQQEEFRLALRELGGNSVTGLEFTSFSQSNHNFIATPFASIQRGTFLIGTPAGSSSRGSLDHTEDAAAKISAAESNL